MDETWLEDGLVWEREQKEKERREQLQANGEGNLIPKRGLGRGETTRQRD